MSDKFKDHASILDSPALGVFAVAPNDNVDLTIATRAIRATGAGNIVLIGADGNQATCAFSAGETRPIRALRILLTGTTATGIEGMY